MSSPVPLSRTRRISYTLVAAAMLAVGGCLIGEVVLRLIGQDVLRTEPVRIRVEPGGRLFATHPDLGYAHLPGAYRVTVRDSLVFAITHDSDGLRVTRPPDEPPPGKPQIWILGGSFTYGWTVNDHETYPWQLQRRMPDFHVVNYGVNGYGTVHGLLQVEAALSEGPAPAAIVVAYGSYHDERNTFLRVRRKAVSVWNRLGDLRQPYARLDSHGALEIHRAEVVYREFPLTRHSVFMHALERLYNRLEEALYDGHAVSEALILELAERCRAHGVKLIVAGIYDDERTHDMLAFCRSSGIPGVDISVDLSLPEHNHMPYDSHPSALTHRKFAERLYAFLDEELGQ